MEFKSKIVNYIQGFVDFIETTEFCKADFCKNFLHILQPFLKVYIKVSYL